MPIRAQCRPSEEIVRPGVERVDARGTLIEILNAGRWESLLTGQMRAGAIMGNHYHKRTDVFFFLTSGRATVTRLMRASGERHEQRLGDREGILLKANVAHAIRFEAASEFIMMKSRRYDPAHPDTFASRVVDAA